MSHIDLRGGTITNNSLQRWKRSRLGLLGLQTDFWNPTIAIIDIRMPIVAIRATVPTALSNILIGRKRSRQIRVARIALVDFSNSDC